MKKLILSLLLCVPLWAQAVTYYFSDCAAGAVAHCVAGNDANDGLTPSTAKKNWEAVSISIQPAGSSLLLAKGGVWILKGFYRVTGANGTKAAPLRIASYVPTWALGGEDRPRLVMDDTFAGPFKEVFRLQHTGYFAVEGLEIFGQHTVPCPTTAVPTRRCGTAGIRVQSTTYTLIKDMYIRRFSIGIDGDIGMRYMNLRDSTIRYNKQGFQGELVDSLIENNLFEFNGQFPSVREHHIYPASPKRTIIRGNVLRSGNADGPGIGCGGVAIVIHGRAEDVLIENNLLYEDTLSPACWGIEISPAYPAPYVEGFLRIVVRGNVIVNQGNIGIGMSACNECLIENNVIINTTTGNSTAIFAPVKSILQFPGDFVGNPRTTVRNNSIYFGASVPAGVGIRWTVDPANGGGTGNIVANNMTYFANPAGLTKTCYNVGAPTAGQFSTINYNSCYAVGGTLQWSAQYPSLALAQAAPGGPFGANDLFAVNPLLAATPTEANGWSMAVSTGSPLINAAMAGQVPKLAYKYFVPNGLRDIGAHEFGATLKAPPPPSNFRLR